MRHRILHLTALIALMASLMACAQATTSPTPCEPTAGSEGPAVYFTSDISAESLVRIFEAEGRPLPMRVDHGKTMLGDERIGYNPGYSFHGRMLALGQVEGMMAAVRKFSSQNA